MSVSPDACPICQNRQSSFDILAEKVYCGKNNQHFYKCDNCDVAFLSPQLTVEEEREFYANEFSKFMEMRSGKDFNWSGPESHVRTNEKQFLRRWPFFKDFIHPGKKVLEIGCSSGFMLLPLIDKKCEVVGIEPSKQFTAFLRHNKIKVFSSIEEMVERNQNSVKFDLILHFFVLEHIRNPFDFLTDGLDLLSDDGIMVFEVPSRDDPLITIYDIEAFHEFYWSVAHNYYFNRNALKFILDRIPCDYEIIDEQRYDLSNHLTWAIEGKPGGQGRYSKMFTPELDKHYLESMKQKGWCDTSVVILKKNGVTQ